MTVHLPTTDAPPITRWRDVLAVGNATIQGRAVISVGSNNVLMSERVRPVLDHLLLRNPPIAQEPTLSVLREVVTISDAGILYRRLQDLQRSEGRVTVLWRNWLRGWVAVPLWRPGQAFVDTLRGRVLTPVALTAWATLLLFGLFSLGLQPWPRLSALTSWQWAVLWILITATTGFHELGHVSVAAHYGVRARAVGLGLLYLQPAGFADVSNSWLVPRAERVAIASGGLLFQSVPVVAGYGLWRLTGAPLVGWYVALNLGWMAFNLIPFIRLDGYWVLCFALDEFNLRRRSFTQLFRSIGLTSMPPPWRGVEGALWTLFAAVSALFTAGLYASVIAWAQSIAPPRIGFFLPFVGLPIGIVTLFITLVRRRRARTQESRG